MQCHLANSNALLAPKLTKKLPKMTTRPRGDPVKFGDLWKSQNLNCIVTDKLPGKFVLKAFA
jgi:hypothetical protein